MIDVNIARIEGVIETNILRKVLDFLQNRHPMLRVRIIELADGTYFSSQNIKKIPLETISKTDENQWLEIAEKQLHEKFSDEFAPLCRITLLQSSLAHPISEIIATFHHAITDGLSCMNFIDELLFYYQKIEQGEQTFEQMTPRVSTKNIALPLLPPVEQILDSSFVELNEVKKPETENIKEQKVPILIIENEAPLNQRRTHLLTRIINPEILSKLIEQCKQQKTTVHGALCAAMLLGATKISGCKESINFSCSSNINLRKYSKTEVKKNYIGCFVSSVESIHNLTGNTNFWNLARACKNQVDNSINGKINDLIKEQSLSDITQQTIQNVLERNSTGRIKTINLSNRGKFDLAENYGKLKIKEIYFTVGQHILGPCLWLGALTFHKQLFCSFAHVTPLISSETMNSFADGVVDILEETSLMTRESDRKRDI
ncbi:MAG: condensation domain-containing protein [Cyanobacteria bacterium P01_A01_bin.84]